MKKKDAKIVKNVAGIVATAAGHPEVPVALSMIDNINQSKSITEGVAKGLIEATPTSHIYKVAKEIKKRHWRIRKNPPKKLRYRVKKPSSIEDLKLQVTPSNRPRRPSARNYGASRVRRRKGLAARLLKGY